MISLLLNLVFPKFCVSCGGRDDYLCVRCFGKVALLKQQTCPGCRRKNDDGGFCMEKCAQGFALDRLLVCMDYGRESALKKLIILFKYKFARELGEVLGGVLRQQFACFSHEFLFAEKALVMPVPLDPKRKRQRGFNQAGLMAEYLARNFEHLDYRDCLQRVKRDGHQAELGRDERASNVKGTVSVAPLHRDSLEGKVVILVDDVATTCSTLNECSRALKEVGVRHVCGLVLARGWLFC